MKKITLILAFLLIGNSLFSQTISGKILDTENNPIPYVTLQIGANYGVITNDEGVFTLETDNFSDLETVSISCLGYKSLEFKLSDFTNPTYILEDSISELSEVFVTNKQLSIEEILTNIRANISKNYKSEGTQRIFLRESKNFLLKDFEFEIAKSSNFKKATIKEINKNFEVMSKQLINNKSSLYEDSLLDVLHIADSTQARVIKATKLVNLNEDLSTEAVNGKMIKSVLNVLDSSATYKLKSGLFTVEDSLKVGKIIKDDADSKKGKTNTLKANIARIVKNNTLVENSKLDFIFEDKGYKYAIDGISYFNDEAVYSISFIPTKRSAKYKGKMYVNTSDFAVVKLDYEFAENRTGQKLNMKLLLGIKYVENAYRSTVIFKKNEDSIYDLYFISQENGNYVYFNRSLKFIRNNTPEQNDKQQLKLEFMLEQIYKAKSELFFIEQNPLVDASSFTVTEEYPIIYLSKYDPSIWKDYSVLSPVQDIINYQTN
ncbi:carboxypeptidase-like regulatory domain-containing protein [Winogradskyella ludwigii]|uniref:carboxypeptidase-like regulatory domain-containing protein n=1 Tax=Winogradskyella ludwigii TaxID=2686076 RepID=UPI0015C75A36|nr:carboxypeptidase-like regulatory domain-containing protein [Winogradskyella ludwigii]